MLSPFLSLGPLTKENQLASLYLKRDHSIPTILTTQATSAEEAGYAEGVVTNTRFGSFPHSTLINVPWGSQVRASQVDTGTRGRKGDGPTGKKRKANDISNDDDLTTSRLKEAVMANTGFIHVLPPTPENWTTSLPHRTQVVYTPDYSYILHRIRARPGSVVVEAGSGSGSFTHAAARAVFDGGMGKVFTFEFHQERHGKVVEEMKEHGLDGIVEATHRDVYRDGFLLDGAKEKGVRSPAATAVFLDLPAPWEALPHLTRRCEDDKPSALDARVAVHICTFSPCIEQAQRTVAVLRRYGWLDIEMVDMLHRRIEVRREYTGLQYEGMRGVNAIAADVDEALSKLRQVENRARDFHSGRSATAGEVKRTVPAGKPQEAAKTLYKDGRLVHRSEPELKTHTSYLVFALLPREWTDEDEENARRDLENVIAQPSDVPKSQRQLKKEAKRKGMGKGKGDEIENGHVDG